MKINTWFESDCALKFQNIYQVYLFSNIIRAFYVRQNVFKYVTIFSVHKKVLWEN